MAEDAHPEILVVFIAHGSRAAEANEAHLAMAERLGAATGSAVRAAFLELAEPSIPAALDAAAAEGARRVVVLPYFLYPGRHMTRDIPALVAEAEARHPSLDIELLTEFGADDAVLEVLGGQIRRGLVPRPRDTGGGPTGVTA